MAILAPQVEIEGATLLARSASDLSATLHQPSLATSTTLHVINHETGEDITGHFEFSITPPSPAATVTLEGVVTATATGPGGSFAVKIHNKDGFLGIPDQLHSVRVVTLESLTPVVLEDYDPASMPGYSAADAGTFANAVAENRLDLIESLASGWQRARLVLRGTWNTGASFTLDDQTVSLDETTSETTSVGLGGDLQIVRPAWRLTSCMTS